MTKSKDEIFYVGVQNPTDVRRHVLEATREIVLLLRAYESLRTLRMHKAELMDKARKQVKDLHKDIDRMKRTLPKGRGKQEMPSEPAVKKRQPPASIVKTESAAKQKNEIDKLEAELSSIESKLHSL